MRNHTAMFYEKDGEVFFYLNKPSMADKIAVPFEFDGPAQPRHKLEYAAEYEMYLSRLAKEADVIKASIPLGK